MNNKDHIEFLKKWDLLISEFNTWSNDNPLKKIFYDKFRFKNFSIWWCSNFINRFNTLDPLWLEDMFYIKYNKIKNKKKKRISIFSNFLKSFLSSLLSFVVSKFILKNSIIDNQSKNITWFHSLSYNLITSNEMIVDRLYKKTPLDDLKNDTRSNYLIKIFTSKKFFLHIFKEVRSLNYKIKNLGRNAYIVDKSLYFTDILYVYWISFWFLLKIKFLILFMKKNKYENLFKINGINYTNVLEPLLISSFLGPIQRGLLHGISMERFFYNREKNQKIVTYGELLQGIRAVYHFLNGLRKNIKIASIQHAWISPYKLEHIFHREDFRVNSEFRASKHSPRPNILLAQGERSSNLYRNFFPKDDIKIIGCLKYDDDYFDDLRNKEKERDVRIKLNLSESDKVLLIVPSIGDETEIINILKKFNYNNYRVILSPHPSVFEETVEIFYKLLEKIPNIEHYRELTSTDLIRVSDCVIGCKSVLLIEAAIAGVPAIRVCSINFRPSYGLNDIIPLAYDTSGLENLLGKLKNKDYYQNNIKKQLNDNFYDLYEARGNDLFWTLVSKM